MTFKSMLNLGNFGGTQSSAMDRYHSGPSGYYDHGGHKSGGKGGSNSGGAALSALTLLAFLFLINVMQQSLQENNSTSTTLLLRDDEQGISLSAREENEPIQREKVSVDLEDYEHHLIPVKTVSKNRN